MEEIKFRGHDGSKWLYGDVVSYKSPTLEDTEYWMADYNSDKDNDDIQNWESISHLGQYTGLKDKNGKEIYEGDIVNYFREEPAVIKFEYGCFIMSGKLYKDLLYYTDIEKVEVIGNIYENKDLLEGIE